MSAYDYNNGSVFYDDKSVFRTTYKGSGLILKGFLITTTGLILRPVLTQNA